MITKRLQKLSAATVMLALSACVQNPATGGNDFSIVSPEQEKAIGRENHEKMVAQFGGVYDDAAVGGYVATVGGKMASRSEMSGEQFHFTVLDSPIVNAFALPGGYVYVTRGLLALANDEAELASVLGHEIGHVTARHGAQRQTRSTLIGLLSAGLSAAVGNEMFSQAAGLAGHYLVASYSREQEFQADDLGLRYMSRSPLDPYGASRFLSHLGAYSDLEKRIAGIEGRNSLADFFATHPSSPERVRRANGNARQIAQPGQKARNQGAFFQAIDGMIYGDSPDQGFVRSREFLHPVLKFAFKVPDGYTIQNSDTAVQARHSSGKAIIQFDGAKMPTHGNLRRFLVEDWAKGQNLTGVERLNINGFHAETGAVTISDGRQSVTHRLIAIDYGNGTVYRFHMLAPKAQFNQFATGFQRTSYSFRKMTNSEAGSLKPYRLRIVTVGRGDTVASLSSRMPYDTYKEARFRTLNGLAANEELRVGQKVKLVVAQ